jgi:hypothetical protein
MCIKIVIVNTLITKFYHEYPHLTIGQKFDYSNPSADGSELIVPAPFRVEANRDN